jgi:hypothetical protein
LQNTKNYIGLFTKGVEYQPPVWCSSMTMHVRIQLLTLEDCWSISTGSCLITLLTALIPLRASATCVPTWRTGLDHSSSITMRSWWKMLKHGRAQRWQTSMTQA